MWSWVSSLPCCPRWGYGCSRWSVCAAAVGRCRGCPRSHHQAGAPGSCSGVWNTRKAHYETGTRQSNYQKDRHTYLCSLQAELRAVSNGNTARWLRGGSTLGAQARIQTRLTPKSSSFDWRELKRSVLGHVSQTVSDKSPLKTVISGTSHVNSGTVHKRCESDRAQTRKWDAMWRAVWKHFCFFHNTQLLLPSNLDTAANLHAH